MADRVEEPTRRDRHVESQRDPKQASPRLDVFCSPGFVMSEHALDTTRKSSWVAESLAERPIEGVRVVEPQPLQETDLSAVHDPAYVTAVRAGQPRRLAESSGFRWDPGLELRLGPRGRVQ
jgi:acetoin utilization deacetylase AcuC-like enzyme